MKPLTVLLFVAGALVACQAQGDDAPEQEQSPAAAVESTEAGAKSNPESPMDRTAPNPNSSEPDASACGADRLGRFLNLLPTQPVKREIAETVGERPIRYIAPGDVVTMDFSPQRLNVETGVDGRIKLFRCG